MLSTVLAYFPPRTHPLTLVHDPDRVLADERIRSALRERGFQLIEEPDPIALRYRVQQSRPFDSKEPVAIITGGPLNKLPYDLWQQGYHLEIELHRFFPNLSYPVLKELSSALRWRLSEVQETSGPPSEPLSFAGTIHYLLEAIFDIVPKQVKPASLIAWLNECHASDEPVPPVLMKTLLGQLRDIPQFAGWPLEDILTSKDAYQQFVQSSWAGFVQAQGNQLREGTLTYRTNTLLPFESDRVLQGMVPQLVYSGTLVPLKVVAPAQGPDWAHWGIQSSESDTLEERFAVGLLKLDQVLRSDSLDWKAWRVVARAWAELSIPKNARDLHPRKDQLQHYADLQSIIDDRFPRWLSANYKQLGNRALPEPHHLYHVLRWLAWRKAQEPTLRVALIVLDGMSLADWLQISAAWQTQHDDWELTERLLLAQVPSITAISRQALVSGRLPPAFVEFGGTIKNNNREERGWTDFWSAEGLPVGSVHYTRLSTGTENNHPHIIESRRTQAICVVSTAIDEMVHGATQGAAAVQASLQLWLKGTGSDDRGAAPIEELIAALLSRDFLVALSSDHGHVEALGMGQPQEGSVVQTRGKRARIYGDSAIAERVQSEYLDTVVWHNDDVLPPDAWVLMPNGRKAFAQSLKRVVGHGGLSIEEMVVPFVTIARK